MEFIEIYKTIDGSKFEKISDCKLHCENKMGKLIDDVLYASKIPVDQKFKLAFMDVLKTRPTLIQDLAKWVNEYQEVKDAWKDRS